MSPRSTRKVETRYVEYLYVERMTVRILVNTAPKGKRPVYSSLDEQTAEISAYDIMDGGIATKRAQQRIHTALSRLYTRAKAAAKAARKKEYFVSFSVGGMGANWLNEQGMPDFEGPSGRADAYREPVNSERIAHEILQSYLDPSGETEWE